MHLAHLVFEGLTGITYLLNYWADHEKKKMEAYQAAAPPTAAATTTGKDDINPKVEQNN